MNKDCNRVLYVYSCESGMTQRQVASLLGLSVGSVNRYYKQLLQDGYVTKNYEITPAGKALLESLKPKNAIILAAGYGMRMIPINMETPKPLLKVRGEIIIERLIRQLKESGIKDIIVVCGFMKERFEYLIDEFNIKLLYNKNYAGKNNLFSLNCAVDYINNTYIVPADIYCEKNPFDSKGLYSWYMLSSEIRQGSCIKSSPSGKIKNVTKNGNKEIGISYICGEDSSLLRKKIEELVAKDDSEAFWEKALLLCDTDVYSRISEGVIEINTYEDLRELDSNSNQLKSSAIDEICSAFNVQPYDVTNITVLKKGMTNRSFLFECKGKKYIMRVPGEGTDKLINRAQEAEVYNVVKNYDICDNIQYINPKNGYKITEFIENAHCCDPFDYEDVKKCMKRLRGFHNLKLRVNHEFDIFGFIDFYESLWEGIPSEYKDYNQTKEKVLSLKDYIDKHTSEKYLTHIDAVPDNFLIHETDKGEDIRLIDWEYAGMQDQNVDIAMFAIYACYDRPDVEKLIDAYYPEGCSKEIRLKIYCYIAACGLLWSNWCEYKRNLGVEFGEYSLRQYRYAKEYYNIFHAENK